MCSGSISLDFLWILYFIYAHVFLYFVRWFSHSFFSHSNSLKLFTFLLSLYCSSAVFFPLYWSKFVRGVEYIYIYIRSAPDFSPFFSLLARSSISSTCCQTWKLFTLIHSVSCRNKRQPERQTEWMKSRAKWISVYVFCAIFSIYILIQRQ